MTDWCILRTSGGRTLRLADWLAAAGYEAWTPREANSRRVGRDRVRQEFQCATLPTFVFVNVAHLLDLAALRTSPASQHPPFGIFRHAGRVPLISGREVDRLRYDEMVRRGETPAKARPKPFIGAEYRPEGGPYAGMSGVVWSVEGDRAIVSFGGWMEHVEVDAWLVPQDVLCAS